MHRTITALYETKAEAERARDALQAAHLGQNVDIHDQTAADAKAAHPQGGFVKWLSEVLGVEGLTHAYGEGLRRGHFLLTAKVDDLNETRAAEILDAAGSVDVDKAQQTWRNEGWTPPAA